MAVNMFPKFNIEVSFVQAGCSVEEYEKQIKPNTKVHESKKMTNVTIVFFSNIQLYILHEQGDDFNEIPRKGKVRRRLQPTLDYAIPHINVTTCLCLKYGRRCLWS